MSRTQWFNVLTGELEFQMIDRMDSWQSALEDGVVTDVEIEVQTQRIAQVLRTIDAQVSDELHELITDVLREVSVLHAMQVFYASKGKL